jgi:hypothetical protein
MVRFNIGAGQRERALRAAWDNRGAPTVTISISPAEGAASTKRAFAFRLS